MPKRLAITISGAVSLGAYEAGVLYETIAAIGEHNSRLHEQDPNRIEIDVITGASAGGMCAVIAAQKLLFDADALGGDKTNVFYRPWVQDVRLDKLMAYKSDEDPTKSILSSDLIEEISKTYITDRYNNPVRSRKRHPAAAPKILLGLAMSNLNGIDYNIRIKPPGNFNYTDHADAVCQAFTEAAADDTFLKWDFFRQAGVATGAFPFAFRVVDLVRNISDLCRRSNLRPDGGKYQTYTDGGVFQNEPLGLARTLVNSLENPSDDGARFYLFVAPGSKDSQVVQDFSAKNANLFRTGIRLMTSIREQAAFQDWIETEKTNQRIKHFNQSARLLHQRFQNLDPKDANVFSDAMGDLLPQAFGENSIKEQTRVPPLDKARDRLRQRFKLEYESLPSPSRETWLDTILFLEASASLGGKEEMEVYSVTVKSCRLAGGELSAFAGFFDESYRQHDYDVGRVAAREFIQELNETNSGNSSLGPINYTPSPTPICVDHSLDGLQLASMSPSIRIKLRERLRARCRDLMKQSSIKLWIFGPILRWLADIFLVKPWLNNVLQLQRNPPATPPTCSESASTSDNGDLNDRGAA